MRRRPGRTRTTWWSKTAAGARSVAFGAAACLGRQDSHLSSSHSARRRGDRSSRSETNGSPTRTPRSAAEPERAARGRAGSRQRSPASRSCQGSLDRPRNHAAVRGTRSAHRPRSPRSPRRPQSPLPHSGPIAPRSRRVQLWPPNRRSPRRFRCHPRENRIQSDPPLCRCKQQKIAAPARLRPHPVGNSSHQCVTPTLVRQLVLGAADRRQARGACMPTSP